MSNRRFAPQYMAHPGKLLKNELAARGLSQREFAARIGLSEKVVSDVTNAKARLQPYMADLIEQTLGTPAHVWNNLQNKHDMIEAQNNQEEQMHRDLRHAGGIDYAPLSKRFPEHLPQDAKGEERVHALRRFLRVASVDFFVSKGSREVLAGAYRLSGLRKDTETKVNYLNLIMWITAGIRLSEDFQVGSFHKSKLKAILPELVKLSRNQDALQACADMQSLLLSASIRTVFVPFLRQTYACGYTYWDKDGNPTIILSSRQGPYWDALLFSWFHEIGHILYHGKSYSSLALSQADSAFRVDTDKEQQADDFAAHCLLPEERYQEFLSRNDITQSGIEAFAGEEGIHVSVLLGRLGQSEVLGWGHALMSGRTKLSTDGYPFRRDE